MLKKVLAILVLIGSYFCFSTYSTIYKADLYLERSKGALLSGDFAESVYYADLAVAKNPYEPNYYRNRARSYLAYILDVGNEDTKKEIKDQISKDLATAYKLNPQNLVTVRNSIPLYYFLAQGDLAKTTNTASIDDALRLEAKSYYDKVYEMAPGDAGFYALLAKYQKKLGLPEDYERSVNKVKELRPDLLDWYFIE